jgi:hypothetical protein
MRTGRTDDRCVTSLASTSANQTLANRAGVTAPARGASSHSFLSDALVARGLVTQEAMDAALDASRDGRRYCDILIADGVLHEDEVARATAEHHAVEHVDLDVFEVEPAAIALVPQDIARRNGALPIAELWTGEIVVAIHDPALSNLVEIADVAGRPIRAVIASRSQIQRHLGGQSRPRVPVAPPPPVVAVAAVQPEPVVVPEPARVPTPAPAPAPHRPDRIVLLPARGESPTAPVDAVAPEPAAEVIPAPVAVTPQPAPALAPAAEDLAARVALAEREAHEANERARRAEQRAEGMIAAAQAANDALAQVANARAIADDAAKANAMRVEELTIEVDALRAQLDAERERHRRVEPARPSPAGTIALPAPPAPAPAPPAAPRPAAVTTPPPSPSPSARPSLVPAPVARAAHESSKKRGLRRMIAALRRS